MEALLEQRSREDRECEGLGGHPLGFLFPGLSPLFMGVNIAILFY
jgi:hypothetical protein